MSDTETATTGEWSDRIVCPYCSIPDDEYTDYPSALRFDGDSTTYECSYCGKDFTVSISIDISYQSSTLVR